MIRRYLTHEPTIPASCYIDPDATVIGQVTLGEQVSVWPRAVLRGDVHTITVGAGSNIQDGAVLHGQKGLFPVVVGERVSIGHNACVHGCIVEDDVLIGIGAVVLNGARIGRGSLIAAGALVPEGIVIPPGSVAMGIPAKVRRAANAEDTALIQRTAANYFGYAADHRKSLG